MHPSYNSTYTSATLTYNRSYTSMYSAATLLYTFQLHFHAHSSDIHKYTPATPQQTPSRHLHIHSNHTSSSTTAIPPYRPQLHLHIHPSNTSTYTPATRLRYRHCGCRGRRAITHDQVVNRCLLTLLTFSNDFTPHPFLGGGRLVWK